MIPFNKPFLSGNELDYIKQAVESGKISGDGIFTKKCHTFFQDRYKFDSCLLTTSCTDALEMAAILIDIQLGDEVIVPSFTFVSTANAFVLRGAKIVFADSQEDNPNIDEEQVEALITNNTKAIVVVHYAGVACNMDKLETLCEKYGIFLIEDAAQAIDSSYNNRPLGGIGHLGTFSFHETKNIISGEGGMLVINTKEFKNRAEIIREKGTNRSAFFRGEVDKYGWVDIGSSFLPSEIIAAFLYAQLESIDKIQSKRKSIWNKYYKNLKILEEAGLATLPSIPHYATNNAHMFYILCKNGAQQKDVLSYLKNQGVLAVFHYQSLHKSLFFCNQHDGRQLVNADKYSNRLIRLPFFYDLNSVLQDKVIEMTIKAFIKA